MLFKHIELVLRVRRREEIARFRVLGDEPERLPLAGSADHDRRVRTRESLWLIQRTLEREALARERALVIPPHTRAELERVLEPIEALRKRRERDTEGLRLVFVPRRADAEHRAATR